MDEFLGNGNGSKRVDMEATRAPQSLSVHSRSVRGWQPMGLAEVPGLGNMQFAPRLPMNAYDDLFARAFGWTDSLLIER